MILPEIFSPLSHPSSVALDLRETTFQDRALVFNLQTTIWLYTICRLHKLPDFEENFVNSLTVLGRHLASFRYQSLRTDYFKMLMLPHTTGYHCVVGRWLCLESWSDLLLH